MQLTVRPVLKQQSLRVLAVFVLLSLLSASAGYSADVDLSLRGGWNLVSLPVEPDDPSVAAVFGDAIRGAVWTWNGAVYTGVAEVSPGVGYWVYSPLQAGETAVTRSVSGQVPEAMPATLTPGWHMLGGVSSDKGRAVYALPPTTVPSAAISGPVWQYGDNGYQTGAELPLGAGAWVYLQECASVFLSETPVFAGAHLLTSPYPGALKLQWPAAVDPGDAAGVRSYSVYLAPRGTEPLPVRENLMETVAGNVFSLTVQGLDPGQSYDCVVVAEDLDGNRSRTGRRPLTASPRAAAELQLSRKVHDLLALGIDVLDVAAAGDAITVDTRTGLAVGDALVFDNPAGEDLLEISAITDSDGAFVLRVQPIPLRDVLDNAVLESAVQMLPPATLNWRISPSGGAVYGLEEDPLQMEQKSSNARGCAAAGSMPFTGVYEIQPGVELAYDLQFAPRIQSRAQWEASELQTFSFSLAGDLSSSLRLSASPGSDAVAVANQEIDLGELHQRWRFRVDGLPVIQDLRLKLKAELSVNSNAGVDAAVSVQDRHALRQQLTFANGSWTATADSAQRPALRLDLAEPGDLTAQIAVYPLVSMSFYSAAEVVLERYSGLQWDMAHRFFPLPAETTTLDVLAQVRQRIRADLQAFDPAAGIPYTDTQVLLADLPLVTLPRVEFRSPPAQALPGSPLALSVDVTDGSNNPVPDENIVWAVESSPGPPPSLTPSADRRSATFTPSETGDYTLRCTVRGEAALDGGGQRSAAVRVSVVKENYLILDLSGGSEAESYPVTRALTVPDPLPDSYKSSVLLLRRLPADGQSFTMGSPSKELGHASDETRHQVSFSNDFYIGVLEVTQRQWERVTGEAVGRYPGNMRPVEEVSYEDIRGASQGGNWPASRAVDGSSFLGLLRARTGLPLLDLPTEAQWEYACRAGTTTALNSGQSLSDTREAVELNPLGRYWYNGGESRRHAPAATYLPNAWGLYDMHGNVAEWCLDWYGEYSGQARDPRGPAESQSGRVLRGGGWLDIARQCRSAARNGAADDRRLADYGFRLASLALEKPVIHSFIPANAEVAAEITVNGNNFTATQAVLFNGVPASSFVVDSDAQLRATVPESAGTGPITVRTVAASAVSDTDFTVAQPLPAPTFVQSAGGTAVDAAAVATATALGASDGDLYLAAISSKEYEPVTEVTGLGLTWRPVDAQCSGRSQTGVELWMAQGTPSGNGIVQARLSGTVSSAVLSVARYSDVRNDRPLGAFVSANTNGLDGACSGGVDSDQYDLSLGVESRQSLVVVAVGKRRRDLTPASGYSLRQETTANSGDLGNDSSVALLDRRADPFDTVPVQGVLSSPSDWAVIAVEIRVPAPALRLGGD